MLIKLSFHGPTSLFYIKEHNVFTAFSEALLPLMSSLPSIEYQELLETNHSMSISPFHIPSFLLIVINPFKSPLLRFEGFHLCNYLLIPTPKYVVPSIIAALASGSPCSTLVCLLVVSPVFKVIGISSCWRLNDLLLHSVEFGNCLLITWDSKKVSLRSVKRFIEQGSSPLARRLFPDQAFPLDITEAEISLSFLTELGAPCRSYSRIDGGSCLNMSAKGATEKSGVELIQGVKA